MTLIGLPIRFSMDRDHVMCLKFPTCQCFVGNRMLGLMKNSEVNVG